ncbi:diadenylate cyclase CdaA [Carboxylicivirga sediminis]|uniref:Diadenylate cyclase n=1 Tax=Carboxylicivirga sediminis TaxID=2006564 RepID=A0A941IX17_9BACT|nr:diadenylate cyclase CdaA [Carboxylicivirga sediminis]MBR8534929.1 diadenylate cyclase CdaA [Carboxylicivirga sediminis]
MTFLDIRFIDLVDIVLVAYLMFRIYKLIKGTVALYIMLGIFAFIVFWILIKTFGMELSSTILDNIVNVGVVAFIVVFQQEIRRFLLLLGSRYNVSTRFSMDKVFMSQSKGMMSIYNKPVVRACLSLAKTKTGALIVITKDSELLDYVQTGELINGVISSQLLENIFFKNSPLHDGAVIITGNKIKAAGCILPVSQNTDLPKRVGLRHRAAMGITEATDAHAIVVSEETGRISFFSKGQMEMGVSGEELQEFLNKS